MKRLLLVPIPFLIAAFIYACAPDPGPFFTPPTNPENEPRFSAGDLGLITPSLGKDYELIAYRLLSGLPLEAIRVGPKSLLANTPPPQEGVEGWMDLRRKITDPPANLDYLQVDRSSKSTPQVFYPNCLDDAFNKARETLTDRQHSYSDPALFKAWIQAQDQVFTDCGSQKPVYPEAPAPSLPELARADREYQIAAAHFYAEDFEAAKTLFNQIAADTQSPWHEIGAYMVGRVYLRQASLEGNQGAITQARDQFVKIADSPGASFLRESAKGLVEHIDAITNVDQTLASLSKQLLVLKPEEASFEDAINQSRYILLANSFSEALRKPGIPDVFDWVETLEGGAIDHSLDRWHATHSLPWLTLSLMRSGGKDPDADILISESERLPPNSPAYTTAAYNSIRLRIEGGEIDEPRRRLNALLEHADKLTPSASNAFRAERMRLATSFDDLLRWAPRIPIGGINYFGDPTADSPVLANDSVHFLNFETPLDKIATAAHSPRLPPWTSADVALSAWTRAFILKDSEVMKEMAPLLTKAHPNWLAAQLIPPSGPVAYPQWQFQTALFISRTSSVQLYLTVDYRNHQYKPAWWCANLEEPNENFRGYPTVAWKLPTVFFVPQAVLSGADLARAAIELAALRSTSSAQSLLSPIVMNWAKSHPEDPLVPEALYHLVRIVRYGCHMDPANGAISKAAFDLLHTRYPNSPWTAQTPYWFK